ncbi:hypothetical protein BO78DRAFT_399997 [Aspergillus sclerotiicarbonarius CBS 121057]|uniref:Uncharacterized protein n=1 Tax=Aspergillus sclerotiicarbonarius (strain CBS 121057 / IBT 28362) TaxID=1448318 RepID=A0A319DV29_ASPSB|nr:hypothetical protein BO78DRAFT_401164 [Aspergillus sclerotiicarbonarius CBS 121057]PYI03101.1 hypothetical protein BO78DRAFT_399997 [Aspergillus sclerotiicarbonarius CBS 121057]
MHYFRGYWGLIQVVWALGCDSCTAVQGLEISRKRMGLWPAENRDMRAATMQPPH